MAIPAHLEEAPTKDGSDRARRRRLRLETSGALATGEATNVVVHNASAGGLLLECRIGLSAGETILVELPHAGTVRARVVWESGHLFGCEFEMPISSATLSAAELRSAVGSSAGSAPDARIAAPDHSVTPAAEPFGSKLRRLRKERRLTMAQLGEQLGVSKPTIWAWEQGKARPLDERLGALAEALGIQTEELKTSRGTPAVLDLIASSRQQIASAYGISPDKVRIMIEL